MENLQVFFLRVACALGGSSVALGAFAAHGLKNRLAQDLLQVFEVGVRYQFYHALAMLALAASLGPLWASRWTVAACWAWLAGVLLFSGSLYALAVTGTRWLGAITPVGGVAFILGWIFALFAAGQIAR